jgi:sugar phosphate isomerase/epimerase
MSTPVALQLWTVREECRADFTGTLARVADMGYEGVELVDWLGYAGMSPAELREHLAGLGMRASSVHAELYVIETELPRLLASCRDLGASHLVCAWAAEDRRHDLAGYRDIARSLEAIGRRAADEGLRLAYHHHDFELAPLGGRRGIDVLLEETAPEAVELELDTYWIHQGDDDPVSFLRRLGDRCRLVHLKDSLDGDRAAPRRAGLAHLATEIGTGVIDFRAVLDAVAGTARWLIVEQDEPRDHPPLESARISLENLRRVVAGRAR